MYTIIFHRAQSDNETEDILKVTTHRTENDVYNYIRLMTFEQELTILEYARYKDKRYHFGDYGFLVIDSDGLTTFESPSFSNNFDCVDVPSYAETWISEGCHTAMHTGAAQLTTLNDYHSNVYKEEKLFANAMVAYREEQKQLEKENKEKALLKELLAKYPDIGIER